MKRVYIILTGIVCCLIFPHGNIFKKNNLNQVYAQNSSVRYSYDSLGRVSSATYPDGTVIIYEYDKNGNLLSCEEKTTSESSATESENKDDDSNNTDNSRQDSYEKFKEKIKTGGYHTLDNQIVYIDKKYITLDTMQYNHFKKRKPVMKSLKVITSKNKYYLKIQIREIKGLKGFSETGYQIQYATNSKFKKTKSIHVGKKKKSSLTDKKWKVSKGKTYYVRVRAYAKTKTGRRIYSKYCKTKKIKISK